jgi:hypothetical protein
MTAATDLLTLWEAGATAAQARRDKALLTEFGEAAPVALSERNAALFRMRSHLFGREQRLRSNCPECGVVNEFSVDSEALSEATQMTADARQPDPLTCEEYLIHFRLPDVSDVSAASEISDRPFEDALLSRCVTRAERSGLTVPIDSLPHSIIEQLTARMEELEPGAAIRFELVCPECAGTWTAPMDIGDVLWSELQARSERLMLQIDLLARTYGWSESDILKMSWVRRAAYLQLAEASS